MMKTMHPLLSQKMGGGGGGRLLERGRLFQISTDRRGVYLRGGRKFEDLRYLIPRV